MKISFKLVVSTIVFLFVFSNQTVEAQFLKKLKKKVERKVEQKIDKEVDKEIDKTLDGDKKTEEKVEEKAEETTEKTEKEVSEIEKKTETKQTIEQQSNISDNLEIYSKFDYVPGDKLLFFEDFSKDFVGDLPSKWNTNGSGAIVRLNKVEGNWFELKAGYRLFVIPDIDELPQDYTIEFDMLTSGLTNKTSSGARLHVVLSDTNAFSSGKAHYASTSLPLGQYGAFSINAYNYFDGRGGAINSHLTADIRDEVKNQPHIAISVTKKRYRLWVNEVKYIDIPRFIEKLDVLNYLKFHVYGLKDGEERVFIKNIKVAEGGVDLRRKLLSEGKISTNGILFDSGSDKIKSQSYGIIRQISQVLLQDESIKLNIIGHTDADGDDSSNLELSKKRAAAVKTALINIYKISGDRLQTDGKGESIPVGDNNTVDGKAQNRRVEFVKI